MEKVIESLKQSVKYFENQEEDTRAQIESLKRALGKSEKELEEVIKSKKSFEKAVGIYEILSKYPNVKKEA